MGLGRDLAKLKYIARNELDANYLRVILGHLQDFGSRVERAEPVRLSVLINKRVTDLR